MFKPVSLFIALRYTRAKRKNHFISFIALSSMLGIALGVMVLITVLSVMNGFDQEIKDRVFSMAAQVEVSRYGEPLSDWQTLAKQVKTDPAVMAVAPQVVKQAMLTHDSVVQGVMLYGIAPKHEQTVSILADKMIVGKLQQLMPGQFGIVIGVDLAEKLNVDVGEKVTLVTPQASVTPAGVIPRFKRFTVVGIFKVGRGFGYDSGAAYINLADAQVLYRMRDKVTNVRLKLTDLYLAAKVTRRLIKNLSEGYFVTNWTMKFGSFFKAIALEKTMMFIILILIIAVAVFNLVSSLVMVVTDKQSDIAILRTFGASPRRIVMIFILQGLIIASVGIVLGVSAGVLLAEHVTTLTNTLQHLLHVQLLSSDVYYVDYLPSLLDWHDVWHITWMAFLMSLIATLYPAWRAAKIQPAEALRYE